MFNAPAAPEPNATASREINDDEKIALLYRLDIKSEEKKVSDTINSLNLAIIESSIIKIWIDEESSSLIKLSLMYNGIVYSIK